MEDVKMNVDFDIVETTELPAIKPLGCFADNLSSPRPLPMLLDTLRHLYA